jgi:ribonuclease III
LSNTEGWLKEILGVAPKDAALYTRALTHGSRGPDTYERLEFLGDRVLGLTIAEWLYQLHPGDAEGKLSFRLNTLVARTACAEVARSMGLSAHLRLGKQALDDGAYDSDNVLGDVVEALIGALFLDHGLEAARAFVRTHWASQIEGQGAAPRHPKSALQEWAAAHNRRPPEYSVVDRFGPDHAPRFRVKVSLGSAGEAEAEGRSKQEAESAAAEMLLGKLP